MTVEELKELQTKVIKKNKNCKKIGMIILSVVVLITVFWVLKNGHPFSWLLPYLILEFSLGVVLVPLINMIINHDDISKIEKEYKNIFVLASLNKFFQNVTYSPQKGFAEFEIERYGMLDMGDRFSSNDYISGTYKNIKFEQSDIKVEEVERTRDSNGNVKEEWETIFKGRYMVFDFNKRFKANMQVVTYGFKAESFPVGKKSSKVNMEDIEFNKMFQVYSDMEHDAFYILTPHFMEKLKKIYNSIDCNIMFCFMDNRLHVAIDNKLDSFECNPLKPFDEEKINNEVLKDIKIITDFVDELNLDNNIFM